jgi:hypothetical protein
MIFLFGCRAGEVPVERDGYMLVAADAILDGFGIFPGVDERFPGVNMLGLMKVAVRNKREPFEANVVEDVVAVRDFSGIEQRRELVLVFP